MVRSDARTEFLGDVITCAVEGGTGYWAQVSQYQYVDSLEGNAVRVCVGNRVGDEARAVLHRLNGDENAYEDEGLVLTVDVVATGISRVLSGEVKVNGRLQTAIEMASRENDGGMIDADDADVIVQAGLLGDVVYGRSLPDDDGLPV